MSNTPFIEAVKEGNVGKVRSMLEAGEDVNEPGTEQDWPALNFAAGKGDLEMVSLLIASGANVFAVGQDNRTPYHIALAAGRIEACRVLRDAEEAAGGDHERKSSRAWETRPYCKAYALGRLREFPNWRELSQVRQKTVENGEQPDDMTDESIVFVHQDFTVTKSMWWNEDVIFSDVNETWIDYCKTRLEFSVPHDFDLVPPAA